MTSGNSPAKSRRFLGAYLLALCIYTIGIYQWPGGPPFILDPRAGIAVILNTRFSMDIATIHIVEWACADWLIVVAGVIFVSGRLVKAYLISEVVLALPTAYYIGSLAMGHGGHFAPGFEDLVVTFLLFGVYSLIPLGLALNSFA